MFGYSLIKTSELDRLRSAKLQQSQAVNKFKPLFPQISLGTKQDKCKHESDGLVYTSFPPCYKCKKCGAYYS